MTAQELAAAVGGELLRPGSGGPLRVVAVALEGVADVPGADALVLHRSHGLRETRPGLAVVGTHDWFDAQLPAWLAAALGITAPALLDGDPRVLVGESPSDGVVAVAGAMTDALVRAAAAAGAGLYVTGAWRAPGSAAVAETGIDVLAVGHAAWEAWGLEELRTRLADRWPDVRFSTV